MGIQRAWRKIKSAAKGLCRPPVGFPLGVHVPADPADHSEDFAHRYAELLDWLAAIRGGPGRHATPSCKAVVVLGHPNGPPTGGAATAFPHSTAITSPAEATREVSLSLITQTWVSSCTSEVSFRKAALRR
jgi:hypothetical protein